jgi:hypothetical protein
METTHTLSHDAGVRPVSAGLPHVVHKARRPRRTLTPDTTGRRGISQQGRQQVKETLYGERFVDQRREVSPPCSTGKVSVGTAM